MTLFQNVDIEEGKPCRSLPIPTCLPLPQPTPAPSTQADFLQLTFFPLQSLAWARIQVFPSSRRLYPRLTCNNGVCGLTRAQDAGQVGRHASPVQPGGWRVWGPRSPPGGMEAQQEASALQYGGGERASRLSGPRMSGCSGRGGGCSWKGRALWGLEAGAAQSPPGLRAPQAPGWGAGPASVIMGTVQGGFNSGAASELTFTSTVWRLRDMWTEGRRTDNTDTKWAGAMRRERSDTSAEGWREASRSPKDECAIPLGRVS